MPVSKMINFWKNFDLTGFTLVIPSVSVGNVPQFTVDLLIKTYNFEKCGTLWHPGILPSVGSDPYDSNSSEVCTASELYINEVLKLATIQLRSSIDNKLATQFFHDLQHELSRLGVDKVIILASVFDYELHTITGNKFGYISNEANHNFMESKGIPSLNKGAGGNYILTGVGFALALYEILSTCHKCTILVKYISEGDNRPDACTMLSKLFLILELTDAEKAFSIPSSWKFVFGGPPPIGIY